MNRISKRTLLACYLLVVAIAFFYYPKWKQSGSEATISWDASGYYMYLPAIFIYKDIKHCHFKDYVLDTYHPTPNFQLAYIYPPTGNYVMKYSSGQAILMSPFFFAAHAIAKFSHRYPADGFSYPYQIALGIGMLLYTFIGLWFLRKILLEYYADSTVAISLIAIVCGSNYINYCAIDHMLTHNTLFTLYCLLIYCTIQFYKSPKSLWALLIGSLVGLCTLIRPTDIVSVIIPLLWGISDFKTLKERINFVLSRFKYFVIAAIAAACFISVQIMYWKWTSGKWLYYSYPDEGFSWLHPHILSYPFSYRSGWLLYSPMLIFAFVGIYSLVKRKTNVVAVLSFMLIDIYIVSAWDPWWYGGRAMVQSYPILLFSIAALIDDVNRTKVLKWLFYTLFGLFTYLNIWWVHNSHRGHVQVYDITKAYYWAVVGRWNINDNITKLLDQPDYCRGTHEHCQTIYTNDFESDSSENTIIEGITGKSIFLDKDHQSTKTYFLTTSNLTHKWVSASADFRISQKEYETKRMTQFLVKFYNHDEVVKEGCLRVYRLLTDGETKNISIDMKVPDLPFQKIGVTFINAEGDKRILIDNLKIISFDEGK